MPINSHLLGPGTLELGAGPLDVSAQLTACRVNPSENVTETDPIKVLSGEQLDGDESVDFSFTLEGTLLQDLAAAGVVAWSWTNMGTEQPFTFIPNDAAARQVQGIVKVVPISIGGDEIEKRMTSDFTWRIKGTPDFEAVV
jgi:hypothetical protein